MSCPVPRNYVVILIAFATSLSGCGGSQSRAALPGMTSSVVHSSTPSYAVVHRFSPRGRGAKHPGGANPVGGLISVGSLLYGTTMQGGFGYGTVFSITTGGLKKTLYRFAYSQGNEPNGDLIALNGVLYGTTSQGGACDGGTLYAIGSTGKETTLHSFCGADGRGPTGRLLNVNGTLYGATFEGGGSTGYACGTVYSMTPSGTFNVIATLPSTTSANPGPCGISGGLAYVKGTFYGTTLYGGTGCPENGGCGTVFTATPAGKTALLYSFQNQPDGFFPTSGLIDVGGTLYGTTFYGGVSGCHAGIGCGTIFSITPSGNESVLYRFGGKSDGGNPDVSLLDLNGIFYGTTYYGGGKPNDGTVFSFAPGTSGGGDTVLHRFAGGFDGAHPNGYLIDAGGKLYGTTAQGGSPRTCKGYNIAGCGTVFVLTPPSD